MLRLTFLTLITLTFSCVTGAEKTGAEKLPSDAAKYVEQCENDIVKLRKTLVVNLGKSLTKATKAGDLDAANAVKAKIEETEKLTISTTDLLGNLSTHPIIGVWARNGKEWEFLPDFTVIESRGGKQLSTGTWAVDGPNVKAVLAGNWNITVFIKQTNSPAMDISVQGPGSPAAPGSITRVK